MDRELIDKLWNQATRETLQNGELNERYHFSKLVAAHERERIIATNAPEIERSNAHIKALEEELVSLRARGV